MILLTVILYDIVAIIVTIVALFSVSVGSMTGLLICGIIAGVAMLVTGWVLATHD